eukprot:4574477-Pleurochrysis_carterae.AAC.3
MAHRRRVTLKSDAGGLAGALQFVTASKAAPQCLVLPAQPVDLGRPVAASGHACHALLSRHARQGVKAAVLLHLRHHLLRLFHINTATAKSKILCTRWTVRNEDCACARSSGASKQLPLWLVYSLLGDNGKIRPIRHTVLILKQLLFGSKTYGPSCWCCRTYLRLKGWILHELLHLGHCTAAKHKG